MPRSRDRSGDLDSGLRWRGMSDPVDTMIMLGGFGVVALVVRALQWCSDTLWVRYRSRTTPRR
jgi:hypothetical protein